MKFFTKEILVEELKNIRNRGWIPTSRENNDGGVGNTLENLLGIDENNLPLPNAAEWELKAQKKDTTALITVFHMEPSPRAFRFVPSILLPDFGWRHQEAGVKYPDEEKSFRQTINASAYSNRGFTIQIDRGNQKILICFDSKKIDRSSHKLWASELTKDILDPQPYWGFDDLFHKLGSKLHNCFLITADSKVIDGKLHFCYRDIYMLKNINKNKFIDVIENGDLYIDIDARTGHNHGTKFRLRRKVLINLYAEVKQY